MKQIEHWNVHDRANYVRPFVAQDGQAASNKTTSQGIVLNCTLMYVKQMMEWYWTDRTSIVSIFFNNRNTACATCSGMQSREERACWNLAFQASQFCEMVAQYSTLFMFDPGPQQVS